MSGATKLRSMGISVSLSVPRNVTGNFSKLKRERMKYFIALMGALLATTAFAQQSTSKPMAFEDCLRVIKRTATQLGVAPITIVETSEMRAVKFPTGDRAVLITCSRPDRKMVTTFSKK